MSNGYREDEEAICNDLGNMQEAVADDEGGRGGDVGRRKRLEREKVGRASKQN